MRSKNHSISSRHNHHYAQLPTVFWFATLIRPPLHELLPHQHDEQVALGKKIGISAETIARRVHDLHEFNPMLGHRGCPRRIVISMP
jgi:phosphoenolpyruvate synthase/pyruvate phosphate dikinase